MHDQSSFYQGKRRTILIVILTFSITTLICLSLEGRFFLNGIQSGTHSTNSILLTDTILGKSIRTNNNDEVSTLVSLPAHDVNYGDDNDDHNEEEGVVVVAHVVEDTNTQEKEEEEQAQEDPTKYTVQEEQHIKFNEVQEGQSTGLKCLSFENEMEDLLNTTKQLLIGMPAKAGGTTVNQFVKRYCMKNYNFPTGTQNYLTSKYNIEQMALQNYEFPPVISSHLLHGNQMINLIREADDDTLIIYLHRPEIERFISAIVNVSYKLCVRRFTVNYVTSRFHYTHDTKDCTVEESALIEIIKNHEHEIGINLQNSIYCSFYDEIEKYKPKIIFAHFAQTDRMLQSIAKRHCPEVLPILPLPRNAGSEKEVNLYVRLSSDESKSVPLYDYLMKKKHALTLMFDWFKDYDCHGKIRDIEERMFTSTSGVCDDEIVQLITRNDFIII